MRPVLSRMTALALIAVCALPALAGLPPMTAEKWRQDLHYFATEAPQHHRNLFHAMTREQFEAAVARLDARIPKMNDDQIVAELARIVAMIRDGHSYMRLGWAPLDYPRLPVRFEVLEDGIVVRAAAPKYAGLVGGKLVSLGGHSADEVLRAASELAPRDNAMTVRTRVPQFLSTPAMLHGLGLIPDTTQVPVVAEKGGKEIRAAVVSEPQPPVSRHGWVPDSSWVQVAGDHRPLWLRHPDDAYWYQYLPDSRTLYIQWNVIENKKDETVAQFFHRVLQSPESRQAQRLVLDIRLNGGGNNNLNTEPVKEMLKSPLNRRGKFFVLIGHQTFSAAQNLTDALHKYSDAVWIGEPTGGTPNSYGDPAPLTLPNSKIQIYLSTLWWQELDERDKRPWQAPEIAVEPTVTDYDAGRDPVMEAVLRWKDRPPLTDVVRQAVAKKDYADAERAVRAFQADPVNKYADLENDFNNLGYERMSAGDTPGAIEVFRLNVAMYPRSWNVYDSLGEAYMKAGQKTLAIENYEKSLKLNPQNRGGEAALAKLRAAK